MLGRKVKMNQNMIPNPNMIPKVKNSNLNPKVNTNIEIDMIPKVNTNIQIDMIPKVNIKINKK